MAEPNWPFSQATLSNDYKCPNFTSGYQLLGADAIAGPVLKGVLNNNFIPDDILNQFNFSQPDQVVQVLSDNINELVSANEVWAAVTIGGLALLLVLFIIVLISLCVFCCMRPNRYEYTIYFCIAVLYIFT